MRTGETLTLPGGTAFELLVSAEESGGERVEFAITLPPGGPSPPRHFHPSQEEQWHVLEGSVEVLSGGRWRSLSEGEALSLPAGAVHTIRNRGDVPARVRDVHVPALDFQDYIETLSKVANEQGGVSLRRPSSLIRFAMVLRSHRTTQRSASPAQRAAETFLTGIGRLARIRID